MADDVEMTPITEAEGGALPPKVSPFGAAPAPKPGPVPLTAVKPAPLSPAAPSPAPLAAATPAPAAAPAASPITAGPQTTQTTIKLKPIIRKPMIHKPVVGGAKPAPLPSAAPAAATEQKKSTQGLKSVTGPIPAVATLRKTGIIAEGIITPAQQQAAKSKTARISLDSAIGVAPVKEGPAPLKTIRLRRPSDLNKPAPLTPAAPAAAPAKPAPLPAAAPAPLEAAKPAPLPAAAPAAADNASDTQKKTLKLTRPGIKKPTLGIKKPAPIPAAQPAAEPAAPAGEVKDVPEIKDIPDIPSTPGLAPVSDKKTSAGVPTWVAVMSLITSLAALVAVGAVMYFFYTEGTCETPSCPLAGANEMPFIHVN